MKRCMCMLKIKQELNENFKGDIDDTYTSLSVGVTLTHSPLYSILLVVWTAQLTNYSQYKLGKILFDALLCQTFITNSTVLLDVIITNTNI